MLTLPPSLEVQRDQKDEEVLLGASRAWLEQEQRPEGIHASDLLNPRRAYWRLVDPRVITDREVPIFLVGKILHAFVLGAMAGRVDLAVTDSGAVYDEELGIWYSPDWDRGDVAEFKTNRRFREPEVLDDLGIYLEQVLVYMAAKRRTRAKVWLLLLNLREPETRRTSPAFRAYEISISEEDLERVRSEVVATRQAIEEALRRKNPRLLPVCREWLCGAGNCPWFEQCQPEGRYGTPEFGGKKGGVVSGGSGGNDGGGG